MKKVVITGMGVVSPIGIGLEGFWDACVHGKSGVSAVTTFDVSQYACRIAGAVKDFEPSQFIEKKKIKRMDRFTQFAVAAAKMAITHSGLDLTKEDLEKIGVIVGSGIGGLQTIEEEFTTLQKRGNRKVSPFLIPKLISNMASVGVTHTLPFKLQVGIFGSDEVDKYSEADTITGGNANVVGAAVYTQRNRTDNVYQAGSTLSYPLGSMITLGASYSYRARFSHFYTEQFNYTDHLTSVSLGVAF